MRVYYWAHKIRNMERTLLEKFTKTCKRPLEIFAPKTFWILGGSWFKGKFCKLHWILLNDWFIIEIFRSKTQQPSFLGQLFFRTDEENTKREGEPGRVWEEGSLSSSRIVKDKCADVLFSSRATLKKVSQTAAGVPFLRHVNFSNSDAATGT